MDKEQTDKVMSGAHAAFRLIDTTRLWAAAAKAGELDGEQEDAVALAVMIALVSRAATLAVYAGMSEPKFTDMVRGVYLDAEMNIKRYEQSMAEQSARVDLFTEQAGYASPTKYAVLDPKGIRNG